jgi:hypothetical protein
MEQKGSLAEMSCFTMRKCAFLGVLLGCPLLVHPQVVLEADGPGNTYELINSVLAPGNDAVENPECIHPEFGRHIAEVWDSVLNQYVFEFYSHVTPDNDRCINTDRQRVEIKTYEPSPDNRKGVVGETVTYKWKFKIAPGYKPSSSFTHIHQIKAVGGDDGDPIFTLTPRKGTPNKMELIHNNTTKVAIVNLSLFEGEWVECMEVVSIHPVNGTYAMTIKRVGDGAAILSYSNNSLMTIRPTNDFLRPKWGIYRSLNSPTDLRDEAVRFAGFSIQEGTADVNHPGPSTPDAMCLGPNYPNPFNASTTFTYRIDKTGFVSIKIHDMLGQDVATLVEEVKGAGTYPVIWNPAGVASGTYLCKMQAGSFTGIHKTTLMK